MSGAAEIVEVRPRRRRRHSIIEARPRQMERELDTHYCMQNSMMHVSAKMNANIDTRPMGHGRRSTAQTTCSRAQIEAAKRRRRSSQCSAHNANTITADEIESANLCAVVPDGLDVVLSPNRNAVLRTVYELNWRRVVKHYECTNDDKIIKRRQRVSAANRARTAVVRCANLVTRRNTIDSVRTRQRR